MSRLMRGFDEMRRRARSQRRDGGPRPVQPDGGQHADQRKGSPRFDLSKESDRIRDLYGRHAWGNRALLARRLVEAGVSFVTVEMGNPTPGKSVTHRHDLQLGHALR